jgi:hypothetical protein
LHRAERLEKRGSLWRSATYIASKSMRKSLSERKKRRKSWPVGKGKRIRQLRLIRSRPPVQSVAITEQPQCHWRKDYSEMKVSQARRIEEPEREIGRLENAVVQLTLDNLILKGALEGNY